MMQMRTRRIDSMRINLIIYDETKYTIVINANFIKVYDVESSLVGRPRLLLIERRVSENKQINQHRKNLNKKQNLFEQKWSQIKKELLQF